MSQPQFPPTNFHTQARRGEKLILCEHDGGHYSVIKALPENPATHPAVLFTSLPKDAG